MLFGIIGTIDRGNFLFDRWPRIKQFPKVKGSMTSGELSEKIVQYFYYLGIYRKNTVFQTSQASLSQSCFIQIFNANEKRLQVVLGIDDECVMASRSMFITNNQTNFVQNPSTSINTTLFSFQDLSVDKKDIVNSVTLVWKAQIFQQVENVKNKLSYMIGVLRHMQQSQDYLSRQIIKITQARYSFEKKLKQKCLQLNKDTSVIYQQFKVKQIFQEYYDLAQQYTRDIQIFKQMSKFFNSCVSNIQSTVKQFNWMGSMGSDFKIPIIKNQFQPKIYKNQSKQSEEQNEQDTTILQQQTYRQAMLSKTTLATLKKLQLLPDSLKDQRIQRLYGTVLNINDVNTQEILSRDRLLNVNSTFQTIQFIKQNKIGLCVYPFDLKKYYNLYTLRKMPGWSLIKKFQSKIFPKENIIKQIYPFSKFKRISILDQKLKYLILQQIIKEVDVYIYYLQSLSSAEKYPEKKFYLGHFTVEQDGQDQEDDSSWAASSRKITKRKQKGPQFVRQQSESEQFKMSLLLNFVNKRKSLNQIIREQPRFGKISEILKLIIQKMEKKKQKQEMQYTQMNQDQQFYRKPKWGFYYVQRP